MPESSQRSVTPEKFLRIYTGLLVFMMAYWGGNIYYYENEKQQPENRFLAADCLEEAPPPAIKQLCVESPDYYQQVIDSVQTNIDYNDDLRDRVRLVSSAGSFVVFMGAMISIDHTLRKNRADTKPKSL